MSSYSPFPRHFSRFSFMECVTINVIPSHPPSGTKSTWEETLIDCWINCGPQRNTFQIEKVQYMQWMNERMDELMQSIPGGNKKENLTDGSGYKLLFPTSFGPLTLLGFFISLTCCIPKVLSSRVLPNKLIFLVSLCIPSRKMSSISMKYINALPSQTSVYPPMSHPQPYAPPGNLGLRHPQTTSLPPAPSQKWVIQTLYYLTTNLCLPIQLSQPWAQTLQYRTLSYHGHTFCPRKPNAVISSRTAIIQ